jgi:lactoylglutathione lyase
LPYHDKLQTSLLSTQNNDKEFAVNMNHLALISTDAVATRDFLIKYFGLQTLVEGNDRMTILRDDSYTVISIFSNARAIYPEGFHFGFAQKSKEEVNTINQRLKEDGFEVEAPSHQHSSWTFNMNIPGGLTIEVLHWLGSA